MADYSIIKSLIQQVVKTNGEQEITGANLQNVLVSMINAVASSNNEDFDRINGNILNLLNYVDTENEDIRNEMQELANRLDTNRFGYNVSVFGLVAGVHTLSTAVKNVPPAERFGGQKITFKTDAGWVTYQNTSLSIDNYEDVNNWVLDSGVNVEGDVTITNNPDYEDLTQNSQNELKFADKEYNADTFSGLGRVYLRKNIVSNKNVLTQAMLADANTIYIIQYDYDLKGATITIPDNCVLKFEGGQLKNGKLSSSDTSIFVTGEYCIFKDIKLLGTWAGEAKLSWWDISNKQNINDEWDSLFCFDSIFIDKNGILTKGVSVSNRNKLKIDGNNSTISCINESAYISAFIKLENINDISISNIIFDFGEKSIPITNPDVENSVKGIYIIGEHGSLIIDNVTGKNYGKKAAGLSQSNFSFIHATAFKGSITNISNVTCKNLICRGDGQISSGYGAVRGILLVDNKFVENENVYYGFGSGSIRNCNFENIYSVNSLGNIIEDDGDAIYLQGRYGIDYIDNPVSDFTIDSCYFYNTLKRGIKVQANGVSIINCFCEYDLPSTTGLDTLISIQGSHAFISNLKGNWGGGSVIIANHGDYVIIQNINIKLLMSMANFPAIRIYHAHSYLNNINISTLNEFIGYYTESGADYSNFYSKIENSQISCKEPFFYNSASTMVGMKIVILDCNIVCGGGLGLKNVVDISNCKIAFHSQNTSYTLTGLSSSSVTIKNSEIDITNVLVSSDTKIFDIAGLLNIENIKVISQSPISMADFCMIRKDSEVFIKNVSFNENISCSYQTIMFYNSSSNLFTGNAKIENVDYLGKSIRMPQSSGKMIFKNLKNVKNGTYTFEIDSTTSNTLKIVVIEEEKVIDVPSVLSYLRFGCSLMKGLSNRRPINLNSDDYGFTMIDTTLGKPIWWDGSSWKDATGTTV